MRRVHILAPVLALALLAVGCGSDDPPADSTTSTTAAEVDTTPPSTEPDRTEERKGLVLAPVLSSGGCPADATTTSAATDGEGDGAGDDGAATTEAGSAPQGLRSLGGSTEPAATEATFPTADGVFCYTVGSPQADGNDLTDATLSETDGSFLVYTRIKPDSIDKLNTLFNACYAGEPTCPAGEGGRGYVAIVWDGTVLYAPAIQAENIAEDGLSLAGGLTERRARDLITLINR